MFVLGSGCKWPIQQHISNLPSPGKNSCEEIPMGFRLRHSIETFSFFFFCLLIVSSNPNLPSYFLFPFAFLFSSSFPIFLSNTLIDPKNKGNHFDRFTLTYFLFNFSLYFILFFPRSWGYLQHFPIMNFLKVSSLQ